MAKVFEKIISKLEFETGQQINISQDLYRIIPTEAWEDFDKTPVDVCSLYDDIDRVKELSHDKNRVCTYVDFDRVASILRAISQSNNPL